MFDPQQREWRFYITDMISFAEKVVAYTVRNGSGAFCCQRPQL